MLSLLKKLLSHQSTAACTLHRVSIFGTPDSDLFSNIDVELYMVKKPTLKPTEPHTNLFVVGSRQAIESRVLDGVLDGHTSNLRSALRIASSSDGHLES